MVTISLGVSTKSSKCKMFKDYATRTTYYCRRRPMTQGCLSALGDEKNNKSHIFGISTKIYYRCKCHYSDCKTAFRISNYILREKETMRNRVLTINLIKIRISIRSPVFDIGLRKQGTRTSNFN